MTWLCSEFRHTLCKHAAGFVVFYDGSFWFKLFAVDATFNRKLHSYSYTIAISNELNYCFIIIIIVIVDAVEVIIIIKGFLV
jgi:hypothetical protein